MDIRKVKERTLVELTIMDIHTDDGGWADKEQALSSDACILKVQGVFTGVTKNKEALITSLSSSHGCLGVRTYIPLGCIVSVRKLK